ncbi:hypothetical protein [Paenibacillus humicola]|nr:hypothetical protein [Paenibacillus humicola]
MSIPLPCQVPLQRIEDVMAVQVRTFIEYMRRACAEAGGTEE